jgi:hypothetical protein
MPATVEAVREVQRRQVLARAGGAAGGAAPGAGAAAIAAGPLAAAARGGGGGGARAARRCGGAAGRRLESGDAPLKAEPSAAGLARWAYAAPRARPNISLARRLLRPTAALIAADGGDIEMRWVGSNVLCAVASAQRTAAAPPLRRRRRLLTAPPTPAGRSPCQCSERKSL